MSLSQLHKIQNNIYLRDTYSDEKEQPYMYFLANHPYLFEEFIDSGKLTIAEMNYINNHFFDYTVDPRTFENEFKRAMRESLPRYNILKSIELKDEIFELFDDKYTRKILSERTSQLAQTENRNTSRNDTNNENRKSANRELPMCSTGRNFDQTVDWSDGASNIDESKTTGSSNIQEADVNTLNSSGTDNGDTTETYTRERTPVDTIDRIWNYILKPKAVEWLTSQLQYAFNLVY